MRLRAGGLSYSQIVERTGIGLATASRYLAPMGGVIRKDTLALSGRRLSLAERYEIGLGLERGWSYRRIGAAVSRAASTVCREVAAGGGRDCYHALIAHHRAWQAARRPKPRKLADPALAGEVMRLLGMLHWPQQIAARLRGGSLGYVS